MIDSDCANKDLIEYILDLKRKRTEGFRLSPDSEDFIVFVVGVSL